MLSHLIIRNFAIIDHLEIPFHEGFTVITGETGAGKSILIDALHLLLGGRATTDIIRTGTDEAVVEGVFEPTPRTRDAINARLDELGIARCEEQLIVRRLVSRAGRNKVFVNGSVTTVGTLAMLTRGLVDISGQHEHYSLLDAEGHLDLLDDFAGVDRGEMEVAYRRLATLRSEQRTIERDMRERATRIDFLEFQLQEIDAAQLVPGEEERLDEELGRLRHAEKIHDAGKTALYLSYESDASAAQQLSEAAGALARVGQYDPKLAELADLFEAAYMTAEEVARDLRRHLLTIDSDSGRLDGLIARSELIRRLCRKYGSSVAEVLDRAATMRDELHRLRHAEERSDRLGEEIAAAEREALRVGAALHARRLDAAAELETRLERELCDLNMARTRLEFAHRTGRTDDERLSAMSPRGFDQVELLISPNLGEEPKALSRIASGGELSRVMLAMKTVLSERDPVDTYIFDEVDTGIGGATADRVGEKIEAAAAARQVLCITHLPQIASRCDHHYLVEKRHDGERTRSVLRPLSATERVEEVARMLGGDRVTARTLDAARELVGMPQLAVA